MKKTKITWQTAIMLGAILLALIMLIMSCEPSPLAKLQQQNINQADSLASTDADTIRLPIDTSVLTSITVTQSITFGDTANADDSRELSNYSQDAFRYPAGIEETIDKTIAKSLPKLSKQTRKSIVDDLMLNDELAMSIDNDIHEVVIAKLAHLGDLGIIVNVDPSSPVNVSNRYEYCHSENGADSIKRKQLKWEKKSTKKK